MNVEGDFRYVDYGAYDECLDFLEYLDDCEDNWEEAFVSWVGISEILKHERKLSQNHWGPLNLVKVLVFHAAPNDLVTKQLSCLLRFLHDDFSIIATPTNLFIY